MLKAYLSIDGPWVTVNVEVNPQRWAWALSKSLLLEELLEDPVTWLELDEVAGGHGIMKVVAVESC